MSMTTGWLHFVVFGLLLGWAGAIPIGPVNLEIMRINLSKGLRFGMSFGLASCIADITYLALFASGLSVLFDFHQAIKTIAIVGACVLCFFAFSTFRGLAKTTKVESDVHLAAKVEKSRSLWRYGLGGFSMTMVNPFTVLFWISISTQAATVSEQAPSGIWWVGLGVLAGTTSWAVLLNFIMHWTRHKISARWMNRLSFSGALLLLVFAAYTLIHFL